MDTVSHWNTLPGQKEKVAQANILLDRLLLWLWSAFTGRDFVMMTGESNHSFSLFQQIPKTFNWVNSGLCGGQFLCENDSSCSLTLMWPHAPLMLHNKSQWILAFLEYCMPKPSGKKKSIDGIIWSFSTFRNSVDVLCLDLTNWSNPDNTTDLNVYIFWPGSVYFTWLIRYTYSWFSVKNVYVSAIYIYIYMYIYNLKLISLHFYYLNKHFIKVNCNIAIFM